MSSWPSITGGVLRCGDCNKVIFDLVQHYKTTIYASLVQGDASLGPSTWQ